MLKRRDKQNDTQITEEIVITAPKDYSVYNMKPIDRVLSSILGFAVGAIISWVFFTNIIFAAICGAACIFVAPIPYKNYKAKRQFQKVRIEFKDLMISLGASMSSGKTIYDAFKDSEDDMIEIYGEEADIVNEIRIINGGYDNGLSLIDILKDFAKRSGLEDAQNFADIFEVVDRQGGNKEIAILETIDVISEKIKMELDIEVLLAGNKNELTILTIMPIVIILMLNTLGSGTANANTLSNIILKLVCLGLFVAAYIIGQKITDIKI